MIINNAEQKFEAMGARFRTIMHSVRRYAARMNKCESGEETLRNIFGDNKTWRGKHAVYDLHWCTLCDVASIANKACDCHGNSCNGCGCEKCGEDFDAYHKAKIHVGNYLTEAEVAGYEKGLDLKRLIVASLAAGEQQIDWKKLVADGKLSQYDKQQFAELINAQNSACKSIPKSL
jgi:hypothetical protein